MIEALVAWFEESHRALPWRVNYDPYHVWVSEAMLQQTQVETVLPYFEKFIQKFPTVQRLAAAEESQVLRYWAGLGYYRRARHLAAAARLVVERHGGQVPADYDSLIALPGVGQYMAGAILSIAFNKPYPVVDGNVRRVLSRLHGWTGDSPARLWEEAGKLAGAAEPRTINQALMELGATVCSFRAPRCLVCPVQSYCAAFKTGRQDRFPAVKKRPATVRVHLFAVVQRQHESCLMKAADGMWEVPTFAQLPAGDLTLAGSCRHTITHHRLDVSVYVGRMENADGFEWRMPSQVAVSGLSRKILQVANGGAHESRPTVVQT